MENSKNQREIENRLKDALHYDRARVQMGKISRFGLMELSRQRLRPSLSEGSHVTCPRCNGTGHIRDTESSALQVLRIIQEEAMKENSAAIHVQAPVDVAAFLLNEKRGEILKIETRHRVSVILIPNKHLETPHYKLERIKHDDPRLDDMQASYKMAEEVDTDVGYSKRKQEEAKPRQEAVVKSITPDQPAPVVERRPVDTSAATEQAAEGFLSRLFGLFRKKPATEAPAAAAAKPSKDRERGERGGRGRNRGGRGRGRDKEERAESRDTKEVREPKEKEVREQRQPKPQRDQKEPREAREQTEQREPREQRESRRERGQRNRDEKREEKRDDKRADDKAIVPALPVAAAAPVAAPVHADDDSLPIQPDLLTPAGEESAAEAGDQPRRRRRRGGRNRNRRDRDQTETGVSADDASEAGDEAGLEIADHSDSTEVVQQFVEHNSDAAVSHDNVQHEASESAPAAASMVSAEPVVAAAPMAQTTMVTEVETVAVTAAPAETASVAETTPAASAAATPVAAPVEAAAPVMAPAAPAVTTVATAAPVAAATPVYASGASKQPNLEEALNAAGLVMAVTNPEKLRKVQEAAANVAPPVRVPRERKPLPPVSDGPLEQIETRS